MREIDKIECASRGHSPKHALRLALRSSSWALTAFVGDRPHAMFGISPTSTIEDRGCPWFLGTDEVFDHARDLLTIGAAVIERMHEHSGRLENSVSLDNVAALRLLRRWGFTIGTDAFTVGDRQFVRFWREI
jgi:hypothetical protein